MQDSFGASAQENTPQQTSEQTPAVAERKSGKGWMVAAIILMVGVVALGVTEFLAYQEISKKDDEIAKLKTEQNNTPAEEKEPEEEVEPGESGTPAETATSVDKISVNLDGVQAQIASDLGINASDVTLHSSHIMSQSDQKQIIVEASYGVKNSSGAAVIYYKDNNSSEAKWKKLWEGHQMPCSGLNSEQKSMLKNIKMCIGNDGNMNVISE